MLLLADLRGVSLGEKTLELLNLCGLYTIAQVRAVHGVEFETNLNIHIAAFREQDDTGRRESCWRNLWTRCVNAVSRIKRGPEARQIDPAPFLCEITYSMMHDPVITPSGHSYDRDNIVQWIRDHRTDPTTREALDETQLIPNRALKDAIQYYEDNYRMFNILK